MTYKLFIWKTKNTFIAVFPEIDSGVIAVNVDKDAAKIEAKVKARLALKNMKTLPKNLTMEELQHIVEVLPEEDLISVSGIEMGNVQTD